MEWIENQPVFFGTADECATDEIPVQLVDNSDVTQVQFSLDRCLWSEQLMTDQNFDSTSTFVTNDNWSIVSNLLCATGNTATGTSSALQLTVGNYYQINITVDSLSVGGSIQVSLGSEIIGYITSTGEHTFYGFPVSFLGNTGIILNQAVDGTSICISEITVYEVETNLILAVLNSAGAYQTEISYENDPDYFVFSKNTVTVSVNWAEIGISNGCYYLCMLDPCENTNGQNYPPQITNCTFTGSATGWSLLGTAAYSSNAVVFDGVSFGIAFQDNVFHNVGTEYCVTIIVSAISGTLSVTFGDNVVGTITTIGTHTITGIAETSLSISVTALVGNTATVDSVCACPILPANYSCNATSNTFQLGDYTDSCTLIINACNNEDGLGFVFDGSGFSPRVRLEAKLRQAKYSNERTVYETSVGKKKNVYFSGRKSKNLCIDLQPEYIHDFLRLLLGFDNVFIDRELYSVDDDEYTVEYPEENDSTGKVRLLVSKQTQNVKNINCSDDENVCTLPPNYLLQADDLTQNITLVGGELILING